MPKSAVNWLLEGTQPSMRYMALTRLLDRGESDSEVVSAKREIPVRGWAAQILKRQRPDGSWVKGEVELFRPEYLATYYMLLILSDLGMTRDDTRIARASEMWIDKWARKDGGFDTNPGVTRSEACFVGNTARALVKFGYAEHPKVKRAFRWMVENQHELGGWDCAGKGSNLDTWEPMSAFAVYPRKYWNRSMKETVEKGAEFFLERHLHKQGSRYEPWYRFHYPVHYYYDLLVGLDFMTALGYCGDRRLRYALKLLKSKVRTDGRWVMDATHPDVAGSTLAFFKRYFREHPEHRPIPFSLEKAGRPSKMITLTALSVLKRVEEGG